jgi:acyl carrier protein
MMKSKQELIKELGQKISAEILKQPDIEIGADEALISSGLIDSFSLVDLALIVEQLYGVRIEDYELNAETFDTLDQLAGMVIERGA